MGNQQTMRINKQMVAVALDFLDLHKDSNLGAWQLDGNTADDKLMILYSNLEGGFYGECRDNGMAELEIEIPGHQRNDGNPYLFTFEPVTDAK